MEKKWWHKSVMYQIYPKSFFDTNADGFGDLQGVTQKLDYLQDLGVNGIWLNPVYCSPMDDGGYDISDYEQIDSMFGSNKDMDELLDKAQKKGIKILMDLVINHSSDEHEWFQKALKDPTCEEASYYIFIPGKNGKAPNNWRSYFGGSAWEKVKGTDLYYLHAFSKKQPDLNWENPKLRQKLYDMMNRWMDKGIAGFRVDAICNIKKPDLTTCYKEYEPDGPDGLSSIGKWILNLPGILDFLHEMKQKTIDKHDGVTVAEAVVPNDQLAGYIGENGVFSMSFNFDYADLDIPENGVWYEPYAWTVPEFKEKLFAWQEKSQELGWAAPYFENHDQPRSLNKYIPKDQIGFASASTLATLLLTLRGTPFIYQGEEIGMTNIPLKSIEQYNDINTKDMYKRALEKGFTPKQTMQFIYNRSRDNSRTPFQWDNTEHAGFTKGTPWFPVNPNYTEINAKAQKEDPHSLFNFYKSLIFLHQKSKYSDILSYGNFEKIETDNNIIAFRRALNNKSVYIACNFGNKEESLPQNLSIKNIISNNLSSFELVNGTSVLQPWQSIIVAETEN